MKNRFNYFEKFDKTYFTTGGYDDYLERFEEQGKDYALRLIKKIKPEKSWKFLDVGCGMGGIVLALRKLGFEARGIEPSQFCLENSPAKKWLKFGDILNLPFKNQAFDVTITIDVLCYLTKKEAKKAIKELSRVTKRFLFIETICQGSPNADQKINPDPLRKDKSLLKEKEIIDLLEKENFYLFCPLFGPDEKLVLSPSEKIDFNNIFVKKFT